MEKHVSDDTIKVAQLAEQLSSEQYVAGASPVLKNKKPKSSSDTIQQHPNGRLREKNHPSVWLARRYRVGVLVVQPGD